MPSHLNGLKQVRVLGRHSGSVIGLRGHGNVLFGISGLQ
jgi:hypothetical protein